MRINCRHLIVVLGLCLLAPEPRAAEICGDGRDNDNNALLVMAGLFTRPAAVLASGSMAYAYFVVHQPEGLMPIQNGGELAAVYSWAFLLLVFTGAGAWSIDQLRKTSKKSLTNV